MDKQLRIWRVVPTSKTGNKAPYFFVETTDKVQEKALLTCERIANEKCSLFKYETYWKPNITRMSVRKDDFGRYWNYHQ